MKNLVALDEGYKIFRTLKTSPAYWLKFKKDMYALVRQLGIPTFFISMSAADLNWYDLQKALARIY